MKKVYIKCKNKEHGAKIINFFIENGAYNSLDLNGRGVNTYYYLNENKDLRSCVTTYNLDINGYTEIFLSEIENPCPYPKWMYVSDVSEEAAQCNKTKRFVICKYQFQNNKSILYITENHNGDSIIYYYYAVDIEEEEESVMELTIDQIAEKFGVEPDKIKIKK